MKVRFTSIFTKLLICFFLVMLPLYALGIWSTHIGSKQMRTEIEKSNESKLKFNYYYLEFELSRLSKLLSEYSNDLEIANFPTDLPILDSYEVAEQMNDIYRKTRLIKESSGYIQDVIYFIPALGKTISSSGYISMLDKKELTGLLSSRGNLKSSLSLYNGDLYVLLGLPFNLDRQIDPNFLLALKINKTEIINRLNGFTEPENGSAAMIFGRGDMILTSKGGEGVAEDYFKSNIPDLTDSNGEITKMEFGNSRIYLISNSELGFELAGFISKKSLSQPIDMYTRWLWKITVFSIGIIFLFTYGIIRIIHRPLGKLIRGFKGVELGRTNDLILHNRNDEFGYLYERFNEMVYRLGQLIEDNYIQNIRTREAEYKQLQSQITPHFLYNSLFTIKQMAETGDVDGIKEFADYLGQYFQYITRNAAQNVGLGVEFDHAVVYLSLQEIRYAPRVRVALEPVPEELRSLPVPKVILQPILENAFEHGLRNKPSKGLIRMTYTNKGDTLIFTIEDNGEELTDKGLATLRHRINDKGNDSHKETTGLVNVHHRLRIRYGDSFGLELNRSELGGLQVNVRLPRTGETEHV
ncbi:histidine kinase [Paenibacillus sp. KS-LC4]|uniref:sensor histidine kinase n=1 Tax=Paenibacillus sp. KS-LC4 TaxID=2979727 RepID=UPI0030CAE42C